MKILLVNHFPLHGSGSGVYTKNIAQKLVEKGHQVRVIVVANEYSSGYDFKVKTIPYYKFPCFTTHPESSKKFSDLSRQEMNDYLNKFKTTILKETDDFQPDIIHCQHIWVAPYAALKTNVPYIITAHGTDIKGYKKYRSYRNMALRAASGAERIIAISKQVYSEVKSYYNISEDKIELIWNGYNNKIFKKMEVNKKEVLNDLVPDFSGRAKHIVSFVGKLCEFKGVDLLIKAAEIYQKRFPSSVTLITGAGELYDDLHQMVEKRNLDSIYFTGNLPQEKVALINNIADVAVVPSRVEPFGLVALEALGCGTPVIASRAGGLMDFINDEVGCFFPMNDYHTLAEKVIYCLENDFKSNREEFCIQYAQQQFSWERVVRDLNSVYQDIVSNIDS
ncbi:MAG: glycosyltransferase family 4 protein [Halothermotrichaceae bacterium]